MKLFRPTVSVIAALLMLVVTTQVRAQGKLDLSKVKDEKVKTALGRIQEKQALIKEILIDDISTTQSKDGKVVSIATGKVVQKLPDMVYEQTKVVSGYNVGRAHGSACDGKTKYVIEIAGKATLDNVIRHVKEMGGDQDSINAEIKANRIRYGKADMQKARETGRYTLHNSTPWFRPDFDFSASMWTIEAETPTQWIFKTASYAGKPGQVKAYPVKLVFSKETGLCIMREYDNRGIHVIEAIGKVTINPEKPIDEKTFHFEIPANIDPDDVEDYTDNYAESDFTF